MLSSEVIASILPISTLGDIEHGDLENDISIVLNWIKLSPQEMAEPTQRVKSAVKSVLKEERSQEQFTRLLCNSINENFQVKGIETRDFQIVPSVLETTRIDEIMMNVIDTKRYYDQLLVSLGLHLNTVCLNMYNKNIHRNFMLIINGGTFLEKLYEFFDDNFLQLTGFNNIKVILIVQFFDRIEMRGQFNQILINILMRKIKLYINQNFKRVWDQPILHTLNDYIQHQINPNIEFLLKNLNLNIELDDLVKIGYNELISLRINEIHEIILDYPKSEISLKELNKCLNFQTSQSFDDHIEFHQRNKLVKNFSEKVNLNLLNSGINTINLIKTYIKVIKSFLIIDHKGVLLDRVIRPIRRYLKTRDDVINKLVLGLLDKEPELVELSKELQNTERNFKLLKNFDELNDLNWVPDPIDALPDFKKFKINDIIQSLISIFDSKDIFIVEFTKLFGNKLINNEANLTDILNLINLLKLRFGKNEFFNLDIMVRDFINSRNNKNKIDGTNLNCLILSHLYWSNILEDPNFKLHPSLMALFEKYNEGTYKDENVNRLLKVIPNFGSMTLRLNGKIFIVSLDKASVLMMFDGVETVSVSSICDTLEMSEYLVNKCLEYWVQQDVIVKLTPQLYASNDPE